MEKLQELGKVPEVKDDLLRKSDLNDIYERELIPFLKAKGIS